ncbi:hypothetical protein K457DRAFT_136387 [Linnemannia elongata AG-77]|uniref:Uncharacterized protein n=1 Tax=Linnemannia elongata AG-77 TaxID=1314771 RepID=A0A197K0V4_9FUNG|nr:hypothetical protein K457DRAFT_136387 [Linnemannia elongata AG-77]
MASTAGANPSSNKPSGFMSDYMSDLSHSQDLNSFLQKNQPTYDPNTNSTTATTSAATPAAVSNADTKTNNTQTPSSSSSSTSTSSRSPSTEPIPQPSSETTGGRRPYESKSPVGSHPLPTAHSVFQKKAIHTAALDNCADLNMELTDCLMGRSGSWWDRASMCMKAKEQFALCCRLNKEALQEKGYAKEGNTAAQDLAILDYADEVTQKAMKEGTDSTQGKK